MPPSKTISNDDKPNPVVVLPVDTGVRFGIDDALFEVWMQAIDEEDRAGFIHYGGDLNLAKYVFAFDHYTNRKRTPHVQSMVQAYAAAYGLDPASYICRTRGVTAFNHPAVQFLLESFQTRSLKNAKEDSLPKYKRLLDKILDDGTGEDVKLKDRVMALDSATRFYKMMQTEGDRRKRESLKNPRPVTGQTIDQPTGALDKAKDAPEEEPESE